MSALIVLNWKMNPSSSKEALALFAQTRKIVDRYKKLHVIVAPPVIYLQKLKTAYTGRRIGFAVQAARAEMSGPYTGSISYTQAKDAGAQYALIGHAEQRAMGITNEDTRAQLAAAYALRMIPILCVGEKTRDTDGEYLGGIKEQLKVALTDIPPTKIASIIIAYEPVWAIGARVPMAPRDMHEMAVAIRKMLHELYGPRAMNITILYGGSISEESAADMMREGDVKGLLIGRASIDPKSIEGVLTALPSV